MTNRWLVSLCAWLSGVLAWASYLRAEDRPNVLLIMVDDLKPSFGAYGDTWVHSPNLDRLAERGMRFDRAYCNQAVCAPSRNNLLIGSRSSSIGIYSLGYHFRRAVPDAVTIPQYFKQHGYQSAGIGKVFHIGHGNVGDERSWSVPFQSDKVVDYVLPESTGGELTREEALFSNQPAQGLPRGAAWERANVDDEAYADGRIASEGIRRLEAYRASGSPFFLALGFTKPHLPFCAPSRYWDLYDPSQLSLPEVVTPPQDAPSYAGKTLGELNQYKPVPAEPPLSPEMTRTLIHGYYAALSYMDAQLGRVLDAVDRLGLAENTIIVLWGDHGYHLGDHGMWTKHTNYEQACRIPILIVAPGVTTPGTSLQAVVETVDLFPTMADLAGLPLPTGPQPIDGDSLVGLLRGDSADATTNHAYHCFPRGNRLGRAIRTDRYRLVEWKPFESHDVPDYELYDYETDPLETTNLAASLPDVVAGLSGILKQHPEARPPHDDRRSGREASKASNRDSERDSPRIDKRPLHIVVEGNDQSPQGVAIAQGGREHGFAIHFLDGRPAFDVRVNGKVTRIASENVVRGGFSLRADLTEDGMVLFVNGAEVARGRSPGLIPVQPKDPLSIGFDSLSAAGDYEAPNSFRGTIISARVTSSSNAAPAVSAAMDRPTLTAGLESHDRALFVKAGWIRDPYITLGPDDYFYLTGTTPLPDEPREQTDPYNTGLGQESIVGWKMQVWRSRDLIDWETLGTPFDLHDGVWAEAKLERFQEVEERQWRLWAPELHWLGEHWALVHTSPSPVQGANLSLTSGAAVARPWLNPMGPRIGRRHDPSLFRDDDGIWWLVWGATQIAPLKPDFSDLVGEPVTIGPTGETAKMGHEGCLIRKIHGQYVLFGTGWSTGEMRRGSYNLYYATADAITGPYSERKFVGRFLGHGTPFQDREGRWWSTAFYNGNVPPLSADGIQTRDLSDTAQTINPLGTTLVPLDVRLDAEGELIIRAKDPDYAIPGPDEAQDFQLNPSRS
ncbi:MAG: sulfatase-like hydrolase/transferase [Planctomycetaceae bacterium]|nr:sulfatase-like hydrolase/transferase [Planctomycetaceae bacterium]